MPKIYISGAITGTDDYMERFCAAEERVKSDSFEVVNPAKVNAMLPKSTSYEDYMKMSFCMIDMCDSIYMLRDWTESNGARMELEYAIANKKNIFFED